MGKSAIIANYPSLAGDNTFENMLHESGVGDRGSGGDGSSVSSCGAENSSLDSLAPPPSENTTRTPNTPEILSALISIHPLDTFMSQQNGSGVDDADTCSNASNNLGSPASPPSPKNLRTQLIKEDLKMKLQGRRMRNLEDGSNQHQSNVPASVPAAASSSASTSTWTLHRNQNQTPEMRYSSSGCDESSMDTEEDEGNLSSSDTHFNSSELTPEDEERRKRRRERNKLAAMKCRQKKRERTDKLEHESVTLVNQNQKMKSNIQELEGELRNLKTILQSHKPSCVNPSPEATPVDEPAHPPSFLPNGPICATAANNSPNQAPRLNATAAAVAVAPPSQFSSSFSPMEIPDFLLTSSTAEDFFSENLALLPKHRFLFS